MGITFAPPPVQRQQPYVDPNDIATRQALAEALSQQSGGIQQIKSPWQGLAQVSDAAFGALGEKKAAADKAQNAKVLAEILAGSASGQPISSDKLNIVMALDPEAGMAIAKGQEAKAELAANRSRAADALRAMGRTDEANAVQSGVMSLDDASNMLMKGYEPQKPDIREVGGNLVQVGGDGTTKTIYQSPPSAAADKPPVGYQRTPDGNLTFIPGGPADPSTAGKTTEATRRNQQLATVIDPELKSLIGDGTTPGTFDALANGWDMAKSNTPGAQAIGLGPSAEFQQAQNSLKTIVASYLYSVSGATANPGEVQNQVDVLTPKLNESPESIAAKKARLIQMVEAVKAAATGKPINVDQPQGGQMGQAPQPGEVMDGYRFKGGDPADPNSWEPAQ